MTDKPQPPSESPDLRPPKRADPYYGYFISFDPTGVEPIDEILAAVAWAAKSYHHTEHWRDEDSDGASRLDIIQACANRAALAIARPTGTPEPTAQDRERRSEAIVDTAGFGAARDFAPTDAVVDVAGVHVLLEAEAAHRREQIARLEAERDALSETVKALRDGKPAPAYCAWCLKHSNRDNASMADHMLVCEDAPYRKLVDEVDRLAAERDYYREGGKDAIARASERIVGLGTRISTLQAEHNRLAEAAERLSDANKEAERMGKCPGCGWDVQSQRPHRDCLMLDLRAALTPEAAPPQGEIDAT